MRASLALACALGALLLRPSFASAQHVHGGLDAARIAPPGLVRTDVSVPATADVPVRLAFAPAQGAPNELLVGVLVAPDAAGARAALARFEQPFEHDLPHDASVGDVSVHAGDAIVAFARDNVFVWVRRLAGTHDVAAVAHAIDSAIRGAPAGGVAADAVTVQAGTRTPLRDGRESLVALELQGDALAAEVRGAPGASAPYRTSRGWFVRVRGAATVSAADFHVRAVDARLRVTR